MFLIASVPLARPGVCPRPPRARQQTLRQITGCKRPLVPWRVLVGAQTSYMLRLRPFATAHAVPVTPFPYREKRWAPGYRDVHIVPRWSRWHPRKKTCWDVYKRSCLCRPRCSEQPAPVLLHQAQYSFDGAMQFICLRRRENVGIHDSAVRSTTQAVILLFSGQQNLYIYKVG